MEISILSVLKYIGIFAACYSLSWLFYRYILHPNYRWQQKGNVCYSDARNFASIFGIVLFLIMMILMHTALHTNLKFTW